MKKKFLICGAVFLILAAGILLLGTAPAVVSLEETDRHSPADIRLCAERVRAQYALNPATRLLRIRYDDAFGRKREDAEAAHHGASEAIIILADFATGADSGPLNPNAIYTNYQWIFVKNSFGLWELGGSGYA